MLRRARYSGFVDGEGCSGDGGKRVIGPMEDVNATISVGVVREM
jgi:hypothetical protein